LVKIFSLKSSKEDCFGRTATVCTPNFLPRNDDLMLIFIEFHEIFGRILSKLKAVRIIGIKLTVKKDL